MNHKITPNGIPNDSIAAQSTLNSCSAFWLPL
jgi:hypothetical protein